MAIGRALASVFLDDEDQGDDNSYVDGTREEQRI